MSKQHEYKFESGTLRELLASIRGLVDQNSDVQLLFSFLSPNGFYTDDYSCYRSIELSKSSIAKGLPLVLEPCSKLIKEDDCLAKDFLLDFDEVNLDEYTYLTIKGYPQYNVQMEELSLDDGIIVVFLSLHQKNEF